MKNETKNITINKRTILCILIASLIVQVIFIANTLWMGKNQKIIWKTNDKGWIDLWESADGSEIITKAELATIYSRNHTIRYAQYKDQNEGSGHWADKQVHFFEKETGIIIDNPDAPVDAEMVDKWYPNNTIEDKQNITRDTIMLQELLMYAEKYLLWYVLSLMIVVYMGFFKKDIRMQVLINIAITGLYSMLMFGTLSKIALLIVTTLLLMFILSLSQHNVFLVAQNTKTIVLLSIFPLILAMIMAITEMTLYATSLVMGCTLTALSIALWYAYFIAWKKILK